MRNVKLRGIMELLRKGEPNSHPMPQPVSHCGSQMFLEPWWGEGWEAGGRQGPVHRGSTGLMTKAAFAFT